MFKSLRAMFRDPEGKVLAISATAIILVGTGVYTVLEGWSPVDALYFSVVTLATVGFGDLHPTTEAAKLFTVVYILSGLGIIAAFLSELPRYRHRPRGSERG
jgi:voltage-gated potassium channel